MWFIYPYSLGLFHHENASEIILKYSQVLF